MLVRNQYSKYKLKQNIIEILAEFISCITQETRHLETGFLMHNLAGCIAAGNTGNQRMRPTLSSCFDCRFQQRRAYATPGVAIAQVDSNFPCRRINRIGHIGVGKTITENFPILLPHEKRILTQHRRYHLSHILGRANSVRKYDSTLCYIIVEDVGHSRSIVNRTVSVRNRPGFSWCLWLRSLQSKMLCLI